MKKSPIQGFTLLELLIVVVIAGVMLAVAGPGMVDMIKRNGVESELRGLGKMLTIARSEAVTRSDVVAICGSSNMTACNGSADWSTGWIVFIDDGAGGGTANDAIRNGTEEILKVYSAGGSNDIDIEDSGGTALNGISFSADGTVVQGVSVTLRVCEEDGDVSFARALLLERTGRAIHSFDRYDSSSSLGADGIFEDVNGDNLTCT